MSIKPSHRDCESVERTTKLLDIDRIVVGHSAHNDISQVCDGKLWRIDIALINAVTNKRAVQVLEVDTQGKASVVTMEYKDYEPIIRDATKKHKSRLD